MTTCKISLAFPALLTLGLLAFQPQLHALDTQSPVCAPGHEVGKVMGRGAPIAVTPHCVVEHKVTHLASGPDVTAILGRSGAAPVRPAAGTQAVQANGPGARAVEWVLGRGGGGTVKSPPVTPTLAQPTVR